jgi:hypothetical protein
MSGSEFFTFIFMEEDSLHTVSIQITIHKMSYMVQSIQNKELAL